MDERVTSGYDREAYRKRLRVLRALHDMSRIEWAEFTGIGYKKWHHYERGYPVSLESLFILKKKITAFKFSSDWLYWGDLDALPPPLVKQLYALEKQVDMRPHVRARSTIPAPTNPVRKRIRKRRS